MSELIKVLFIGDAVGKPGRETLKELWPKLKKRYAWDFVLLNGENAAGGVGITGRIYQELMDIGCDGLTAGNHVWDKKEFIQEIENCPKLARPANYPPGVPGRDHIIIEKQGVKIAVLNFNGRVFMPCIDCPFQSAEKKVKELAAKTPIVIVDFHAEATSEKAAFGWYLDGKVSAVLGTHTHVQTADEKILPFGTAFISDVGMVGARDSVIGVQSGPIVNRFLLQLPQKFEPEAKGPMLFNAVLLTIDKNSGKSVKIERINEVVEAS